MTGQSFSSSSPAWRAAVEFHGHACPGVAIGCRMALAAVRALNLDADFLTGDNYPFRRNLSPDEELVCVAETDACCVDGVQALLGCTLGKGNLLLKLRGKTAMSFYHRPTKSAARIIWQAHMDRPEVAGKSRDERMEYFLSAPEDALLKVSAIPYDPPSRALIARSFACSKCGERTAEYAIRLRDSKPYCPDCWPESSRIL